MATRYAHQYELSYDTVEGVNVVTRIAPAMIQTGPEVSATGNNLQQFSFGYLMELLGRFIDWRVIGALVLTLLVWYLLSRKLRMATFAVLGIAVAPLLESMLSASVAAPAAAASAATPGQVAAANTARIRRESRTRRDSA